jgi:hypothetical protein
MPEDTLQGLRLMEEGGEYGELAIELTAALAKAHARVTLAEQRELRELLAAMNMPTSPVDQLETNG